MTRNEKKKQFRCPHSIDLQLIVKLAVKLDTYILYFIHRDRMHVVSSSIMKCMRFLQLFTFPTDEEKEVYLCFIYTKHFIQLNKRFHIFLSLLKHIHGNILFQIKSKHDFFLFIHIF